MSCHKLTQGVGTNPRAGVVVLRAQFGSGKLLRLDDGGTGTGSIRHTGVQRIESRVEGVGRGLTRRSSRVIRAGDGIRTGVVDRRVHATLLNSLCELGRDQLVGLGNAVAGRHGTGHHHRKENADSQKHHQGDDVRAIRLLGVRLLAVIRFLLIGSLCHR